MLLLVEKKLKSLEKKEQEGGGGPKAGPRAKGATELEPTAELEGGGGGGGGASRAWPRGARVGKTG